MNKGFTLIEILVVIVVIGILSAFILVGMSSITNSANIAKSQAFINSINNALLLARVSQWKFDEGSGTTANDSWGSSNGTWSGVTLGYTAPSWRTSSECVSNGCLAFDGTDDYVSGTLNGIASVKRWTVSAWFKTTDTNGSVFDTRTGSANGVHFFKNAANDWRFYIASTVDAKYYLYTLNLSENIWHNVATTRNGDNSIALYVDGLIQTPSSKPVDTDISALSETWSNFTFAANYSHSSNLFTGLIDDVRVYSQAIPTSQINQNYFVGLNKLYKNNGIVLNEFNQRIGELKFSMVNN